MTCHCKKKKKTYIKIRKEDFTDESNNQSKTVTINKPGFYCLMDDIAFNPKENNKQAIIIDSNYVVLTLNGHTLEQEVTNVKTSIIGIKVLTGHTNITILGSNGLIKNFSQLGVSIDGGNKNIILGDKCSDLYIKGCGGVTQFSDLDDGVVQYQGGIQIGETYLLAEEGYPAVKGTVENVKMIRVKVNENPYGASIGIGNQLNIDHCSFSNNVESRKWGIDTDFVLSAGLSYEGSKELGDNLKDVTIMNSLFNNNIADASITESEFALMSSLVLTEITGVLKMKNCTVNGSSAKGGLFFNSCDGQAINAEKCIFENCTFNKNVAESLQGGIVFCSGFFVQESIQGGITFKDCVFSNNKSVTTSSDFSLARGLNVNIVDTLYVIDCIVKDNTSSGSIGTTGAGAIGILIFNPDVIGRNIYIKGLVCCKNLGDTESEGVYGLDLEHITIKDSRITHHGSKSEDYNIFFQNVNCATIKRTKLSNSNKGFEARDSNKICVSKNEIVSHDIGITLLTTTNSSVKNNCFSKNRLDLELIDTISKIEGSIIVSDVLATQTKDVKSSIQTYRP